MCNCAMDIVYIGFVCSVVSGHGKPNGPILAMNRIFPERHNSVDLNLLDHPFNSLRTFEESIHLALCNTFHTKCTSHRRMASC